MEFTLVYQGILNSNGNPEHKQEIRRVFHPQLQDLWRHPPLDTMQRILTRFGSFQYATLINNNSRNVAELEITYLRPNPPGSLIIQGGDIDNRLKTLFDALSMPQHPNQIPEGDLPQNNEEPFFCLLENDCLITKVSVETDRLLQSAVPPNHVEPNYAHLIIRVKSKGLAATWFNIQTP